MLQSVKNEVCNECVCSIPKIVKIDKTRNSKSSSIKFYVIFNSSRPCRLLECCETIESVTQLALLRILHSHLDDTIKISYSH